jgi:hypothetical protein
MPAEWRIDGYWPAIDWEHVDRVSAIDTSRGIPRFTAYWTRLIAWMRAGRPFVDGSAMFRRAFQGYRCAGCGFDCEHHVSRAEVTAEAVDLLAPDGHVVCLPCAWWLRSGQRPGATTPVRPLKMGQLSLFDL